MKSLKEVLKKYRKSIRRVAVFVMLLPYATMALADQLPWEKPLCAVATALNGPTAFAIATVAFFAAAATFLWGEEIAGMSKKLVTIVMAVSILLGGVAFVSWVANKMGSGASSATCQNVSLGL